MSLDIQVHRRVTVITGVDFLHFEVERGESLVEKKIDFMEVGGRESLKASRRWRRPS